MQNNKTINNQTKNYKTNQHITTARKAFRKTKTHPKHNIKH